MDTLTIQLTNERALKALHSLEEKHFIRIVNDAALDSPALPGGSLSLEDFKHWINQAEGNETISLTEAKQILRLRSGGQAKEGSWKNLPGKTDEITGYIAFINRQPLNSIQVVNSIFETLEKIRSNPFAFKECGLFAYPGS